VTVPPYHVMGRAQFGMCEELTCLSTKPREDSSESDSLTSYPLCQVVAKAVSVGVDQAKKNPEAAKQVGMN
jgi:hypothetical protein